MNFDFEQSPEKGILIISGSLSNNDDEDLKRILLCSILHCPSLYINLQQVTAISEECLKVLRSVVSNSFSERIVVFSGKWKNKIEARG